MIGRFDRHKSEPLCWYNKVSDLLGAAACVWACQDDKLSELIVERSGLGSGYIRGPPIFFIRGSQ